MNKEQFEDFMGYLQQLVPADQHPADLVIPDDLYFTLSLNDPKVMYRFQKFTYRTGSLDIRIHSNYQWQVMKEAKKLKENL